MNGASPGPLSQAHRDAHLACSTCHAAVAAAGPVPRGAADPTPVGEGACVSCHGPHSLRGGHAKLGAMGRLDCATCHPAHGDGTETVTFGAKGTFVHTRGEKRIIGSNPTYAFSAGTVVPIVRASSCTGACHDLDREGDPLRSCVGNDDQVVRCLGEHSQEGAPTLPDHRPGVCAKQHDAARFAARQAAITVASASPSPATTGTEARLLAITRAPRWLAIGPIALGLLAWLAMRRRDRGLRLAASNETPTAPAPLKQGLRRLPVIDANRCLGCYACVDACAFDVLTVQRYVAQVARPETCCQATTCADACPNGSLIMSDVGPGDGAKAAHHAHSSLALGPTFEMERLPGVFVVGDVTGVPLIKNAIAQARVAIDAIACAPVRRATGASFDVDVLIVGAGPAGLAASLRAEEMGLSYLTFEQGAIASSIRSFPRGKLVFDVPIFLPLEGEIAVAECTKEDLIRHWLRIVRARRPRILEHHRVTGLNRNEDGFTVAYERSDKSRSQIRARCVVVAIGQRGTPRRLEATVAAGAESMVADTLLDARSFSGKRVAIVGLGDSAMEAAQALAHQPGTTVTLIHRGTGFERGRQRNIDQLRSLLDAGRVALRPETKVSHIGVGFIELTRSAVSPNAEGERTVETLEVDAVLALLGGVPSGEFLGFLMQAASAGAPPGGTRIAR